MAYWYWLTPEGERRAPTLESHRGDVARALAATQPAKLGAIWRRAERDGTRSAMRLKDLVSFHLWEFHDFRAFIPPLVDRERIGHADERAAALAQAAAAPTLAEAIAIGIVSPMTVPQIAAELSRIGRTDATDAAVAEVVTPSASVACIQAADGRTFYIPPPTRREAEVTDKFKQPADAIAVRVTVLAGTTFRGVKHDAPTDYWLPLEIAAEMVAQGVAKYAGTERR